MRSSDFTFDPVAMAVLCRHSLSSNWPCSFCKETATHGAYNEFNRRVFACDEHIALCSQRTKSGTVVAIGTWSELSEAREIRRVSNWAKTLEREAREKL